MFKVNTETQLSTAMSLAVETAHEQGGKLHYKVSRNSREKMKKTNKSVSDFFR